MTKPVGEEPQVPFLLSVYVCRVVPGDAVKELPIYCLFECTQRTFFLATDYILRAIILG